VHTLASLLRAAFAPAVCASGGGGERRRACAASARNCTG
jgi:hypothetical protein